MRRYNGHAWTSATLPGDALAVSPLSATDMWAWGPTTKTLGRSTPVVDAMHWNGRSWSTLAVPRYVVSGHRAIVQQLVATGPSSLWAVEGLAVNRGPAGLRRRAPSSRTGTVISGSAGRDKPVTGQGGLAGDGHGGVWLQAVKGTTGPDEFLHYSGGRLAAVPEPTALTGLTTSVSGMALIPGTTSLWAAASLSPGSAGLDDGAILKYGR